ncbi:MAG: pyridoxal-phosphate dependent enzyme [Thermoleophilia bacterium]|nr:pyridoxal-phosphate dependent enzyme [Thermoleophilia bacterium]
MAARGRECIAGLDRVTLCALPTPLVEAERLRECLQGPRLFIKRDDLTGLAAGGNKARACEFVLAEARASGSDTLIAVGPQHSNQLCALAAAAKRCGMRAIVLLLKGDNRARGNLLLLRLLGAEVRFTGVDIADIDEAHAQMEHLAGRLRSGGATPYQVRYDALPVVGTAGYVLLMGEILDQLGARCTGTCHVFAGSGSGSTQAGLIVGNRLLGGGCKVYGVILDERRDQEAQERSVLAGAEAASTLFETGLSFGPHDVECIPGYARDDAAARDRTLEVRKLVARSEAVLLDPIYTGKVMAALIDQVRSGRIPREDTVVFYHSGGIPAVFSHRSVESL